MNERQHSIINAYINKFRLMAIEIETYTYVDLSPFIDEMEEYANNLPKGSYEGKEGRNPTKRPGAYPREIGSEIESLLRTPAPLGQQKQGDQGR